MATPESGTMTFVGLISRRTYVKDVYISDVANALINFDGGTGGAGATTPTHWRPREPVILRDFAIVTGTADTTKIEMVRDSARTGDVLRYVPHLTTNALRPPLSIGFRAGQDIQAVQLA